MPRYDCILFDLDGTLTDSGPGIMRSAAYSLASFGISEPDPARLRLFVGPPLIDTFMTYGLSHDEAEAAVAKYRERYIPIGLYENEPYPGIPELLSSLRAAGLTLCVATSKPEWMAEKVLSHFHLRHFFTEVVGATMDEKRTHKDEVLEELKRRLSEAAEKAAPGRPSSDLFSRTVMVGDRILDVKGAAAVGLDGIGVLYGYSVPGEFEDSDAVYLAETPEKLGEFLLRE